MTITADTLTASPVSAPRHGRRRITPMKTVQFLLHIISELSPVPLQ